MNDKIQAYREAVDGFYLDALNNLLSEPDGLIVDMLVDKVKELDTDDYDPNSDHARRFLSECSVVHTDKKRRQNVPQRGRWSGNKSASDVVWEAVQELTGGDKTVEFSIKKVYGHILEKYPDFKRGTVGPRLLMDCPNHPSYNRYSGKNKYYYSVRIGIYRLL